MEVSFLSKGDDLSVICGFVIESLSMSINISQWYEVVTSLKPVIPQNLIALSRCKEQKNVFYSITSSNVIFRVEDL